MIRKIKDIIKEVKYVYQRVRYGYDERIKWKFDSYFSQFIPSLKEFCIETICEEESKKMNIDRNEKRIRICYHTLDLIYDFENMPDESFLKEYNEIDKMWEYIGKNLRWFWS